MSDLPDETWTPALPQAGPRGSLLPMAASLIGVLAVTAFAVDLALRMERREPEPPATLTGSAPSLAGQALPPPPGCGEGYVLLRRCRRTGETYSLYVPRGHVPDRSYPLVVWLRPTMPSEASALQFARVWGRLADQYRYLVVAAEGKARPHGAPAPQGTMDLDRGRLQRVLAIVDEMLVDFHVDWDGVLLDDGTAAASLARYLLDHADWAAEWRGNLSGPMRDLLAAGESLPAFTLQAPGRPAGDGAPEAEIAALLADQLARQAPPVRILMTPELRPAVPVRVTIAPIVSARAGKVRRYRWDFGKLASTVSYQKSHLIQIRQEGSYLISLTVTDERGREHRRQATLVVPSPRTAENDRSPDKGS